MVRRLRRGFMLWQWYQQGRRWRKQLHRRWAAWRAHWQPRPARPQVAPPASQPQASLLQTSLRWTTRGVGWSLTLALALFWARWLFLRLRQIKLAPTPYTTPPITPDMVAPHRRLIVLSDLHLGAGDRLDDFSDDEALVAFIDHYVLAAEPTELILAGDTLEFLQVRLPHVRDDEYSDAAAAARLAAIVAAHPTVFAALARLVADQRHQLTVLIGNHDFELHYPAAKAQFAAALGLAPDNPQLRFGLSFQGHRVYIVHGNQFDGWNRFVRFEGISEPFEVVRGTQLVKEVINELEEDSLPLAPLVDNVKPSSSFFWYLMALPRLRNQASRRFLARGVTGFIQVVAWPTPHQMPITGRGPGGLLSLPIMRGFWRLVARFRRGRVERQHELSRQVGRMAEAVEPPDEVVEQMQIEATRQFEREQRSFNDRFLRAVIELARQPAHRDDLIFVCGHTHVARSLMIGPGQTYVNTGTWTEIIYDVATMRRQEQRFPFLEISYPAPAARPQAQLLVWTEPTQTPQPWVEDAAMYLQRK
ncbi:MAG: metallophosphoesterase [Oscillochloridaceae bacterium umkhey_bin13]